MRGKQINFILGESCELEEQDWEVQKREFLKLRKQKQDFSRQQTILTLPYTKVPIFARFKRTAIENIALAIRPVCFGITFIAAALLIAFHNFSSVLWWVFACLIAPLLIFTSYRTIMQIYYETQVANHESDVKDGVAVEIRDGPPGSGKTSSLINDFKVLADKMWNKINHRYMLYEPFLKEIPYWPQKEREDAEEIIEAYEFYNATNTYPCLWTSVPAFVDGLAANMLTADHLMQRKRLPYGSVVILDETSLILPQELYRDKPYEIIEMCKFPRHFGDFKYGSTEQNEDSNLIYLRRVAGCSKHMIKQEWIQKPKILMWIYDKLLDKVKVMTKKKVNFFICFDKIIHSMGYRKYYYTESFGGFASEAGIQTFILKPNLAVEYDERAYKNAYRCKNKALEQASWEHLRLSDTEIKMIFTKELMERGKSRLQIRREATEKRLKKKEQETQKSNESKET